MLEINKLTGGYVNIPVLKEVSFSVAGWPTDWFDWTKWSWEVNHD